MWPVRWDATTHRHLRGNLTSRSAKIKYVDVGDSANHDTLYDGIGAKETTEMRYFVELRPPMPGEGKTEREETRRRAAHLKQTQGPQGPATDNPQ